MLVLSSMMSSWSQATAVDNARRVSSSLPLSVGVEESTPPKSPEPWLHAGGPQKYTSLRRVLGGMGRLPLWGPTLAGQPWDPSCFVWLEFQFSFGRFLSASCHAVCGHCLLDEITRHGVQEHAKLTRLGEPRQTSLVAALREQSARFAVVRKCYRRDAHVGCATRLGVVWRQRGSCLESVAAHCTQTKARTTMPWSKKQLEPKWLRT